MGENVTLSFGTIMTTLNVQMEYNQLGDNSSMRETFGSSDNNVTDVSFMNISLVSWNTTSAPVATKNSHFYQREQVGFLTFLFVGILIGNAAVLLAIGVAKRGHKSRMTFFIMHLAISDLLVGFVSVLTDLIWKVTVYWYAGNVMCHIVRYLQGVAMFASTYVLVALSIDRLEAIARPMSFTSSRVRARILVTVAWVLSALMALPMVILNKHIGKPGHPQCGMHLPSRGHWQIYVSLLASVLFFIPTIIICICYFVIIHVIWSKSKVLTAPTHKKGKKLPFIKRFTNKDTADGSDNDGKYNQIEGKTSSRGIIPQAKIRTIKLTLVIVLVFIISWSPFFIFNMLDVFGKIPRTTNMRGTSILIQSFAPLNSLANPIIYGIFSTRICRNLRRINAVNWLLRKLCCCCPCINEDSHQGSIYASTVHTYATVTPGDTHHSRSCTHSSHLSLHSNTHGNINSHHSNLDIRHSNMDEHPKNTSSQDIHADSQLSSSCPIDVHHSNRGHHQGKIDHHQSNINVIHGDGDISEAGDIRMKTLTTSQSKIDDGFAEDEAMLKNGRHIAETALHSYC